MFIFGNYLHFYIKRHQLKPFKVCHLVCHFSTSHCKDVRDRIAFINPFLNILLLSLCFLFIFKITSYLKLEQIQNIFRRYSLSHFPTFYCADWYFINIRKFVLCVACYFSYFLTTTCRCLFSRSAK